MFSSLLDLFFNLSVLLLDNFFFNCKVLFFNFFYVFDVSNGPFIYINEKYMLMFQTIHKSYF